MKRTTLTTLFLVVGGLICFSGYVYADGMPVVDQPGTEAVSEPTTEAPVPETAPDIDPTIIGTWQWLEASTPVGSLTPMPRQEYTMTFAEDGTVHISAEANQVRGEYTADGEIVAIELQTSTRAAWLPGSPAPRLIELLGEAREYTVTEGVLELATLGGAGSLDFQRVE